MEGHERDVAPAEESDSLDEVPQAPSEAVESPNHKGIAAS
jgi:hypothetical protein